MFPEYVCIEDVDKIISSVQRAPEEAAGRGEPGKHLTAPESRFTPIHSLTASARTGKGPACSAQHGRAGVRRCALTHNGTAVQL